MISMKLIWGASAVTAATGMAVLATLTASACGGAATSTSAPTNGLEKVSPADVLQATAAALQAAKSVHIVGTGRSGHLDARMQHGSATGTITLNGHQLRVTIVGGAGYLNSDRAGLMWFGVPPPGRRCRRAGRRTVPGRCVVRLGRRRGGRRTVPAMGPGGRGRGPATG